MAILAAATLALSPLSGGFRALTCGARAQVIHQVAILKRRLEFPADAPRALRALAERCMAIDPSQRSTFDQVKTELAQLRAALPAPYEPEAGPSWGRTCYQGRASRCCRGA